MIEELKPRQQKAYVRGTMQVEHGQLCCVYINRKDIKNSITKLYKQKYSSQKSRRTLLSKK